jgi:PBP1b-binding outer membrane lipoprotein LpoB
VLKDYQNHLKNIMKKIISIFLCLLFFSACSRATVPKNVKNILKKNCNSCHGWSNFSKIKSKERKKWDTILQRMIRKGARLKNEEYKTLLDFFVNN